MLQSSRLLLRALEPGDLNTTYLRWLNDPAVNRYLETRFLPQTLEALQFVVRQMCKTNAIEGGPFVVDVLDYRTRRRRTMEEQAKEGAVAVLNGEAERIDLNPMSPYERRLVHNYIQENFPELSSQSEGQGPDRHIVISFEGLPGEEAGSDKSRADEDSSSEDFEDSDDNFVAVEDDEDNETADESDEEAEDSSEEEKA